MRHRSIFMNRLFVVFLGSVLALLSACGGGGGNVTEVNTPPAVVTPPPATLPGTLTLLAGVLGGGGNVDGVPGRLNRPLGIAADAAGTVYVADSQNHTIRKITGTGVATLAGTPGQRGSRDGTGTAASFAYPEALAVDIAGNVYVADTGNGTIRKITSSGQVTTLAGSPDEQQYVDGIGAAARFSRPKGIAVDVAGNLFVSDSNVIRKITATGAVTTIAGTPGGYDVGYGYVDGVGTYSKFFNPVGIAVDAAGNVFVADSANRVIRKISPGGNVTTHAGTGGAFGNVDGYPGAARFEEPIALTIDSQGNLLVRDMNSVRKVSADGFVTTLDTRNGEGANLFQYTCCGSGESSGIASDAAGNVYLSKPSENVIYKRAPDGVASVVAGTLPLSAGFADGLGSAAKFSKPNSLGTDAAGNIYVADLGNNAIRRITPSGAVTTVATNVGATKAQGYTFAANFNLSIDKAGNTVLADAISHLVRRLMPDGSIVTVTGSLWPEGRVVFGGGDRFSSVAIRVEGSIPTSLTDDGLGTLYIVDVTRIRKITADGGDSIIMCGTSENCLTGASYLCSVFGFCGTQSTSYPAPGLARDTAGNLYTSQGSSIVKITPAGAVTVLAGASQQSGFADDTGTSAKFAYPTALAIDAAGNIFVADTGNHTVRKVTPAGVVTTIAGRPGILGVTVGTLPASLTSPNGIVVSPDGKTIYVTSENAVLKIQP